MTTQIMDNARVMIACGDGTTRMWIASTPGVFGGWPNMTWTRELSDGEQRAMLENPWRVFDKPEPNGQVMRSGAGEKT